MDKVKLQVFGKVQGVFFRHSTRQKAQQLCVGGWIKNMPDGSVLCEADGEKAALLEFIEWCKQGPQQAEVSNIHIQWLDEDIKSKTEKFSVID